MLSNTQYNQFYERCRHSWCGRRIIRIIKYLLSCDPFRIKLKIKNEGSLHIKKRIIGKNNIITIAKGACLDGVFIRIQGSNNIIDIGSDTIMAQRTCIYMYGNNLELRIGDNCTFNHDCELLVQEDFSKIIIGNDCMFSHHINVRTSDAHPIYIIGTTQRANPAKSILIGSHVWIGANVIIQKGCKIGNGVKSQRYNNIIA